jgi:hypothetical protein
VGIGGIDEVIVMLGTANEYSQTAGYLLLGKELLLSIG